MVPCTNVTPSAVITLSVYSAHLPHNCMHTFLTIACTYIQNTVSYNEQALIEVTPLQQPHCTLHV